MLDGEGKYLQSLFPLCVLALIESGVDDRICANSQTSAFRESQSVAKAPPPPASSSSAQYMVLYIY